MSSIMTSVMPRTSEDCTTNSSIRKLTRTSHNISVVRNNNLIVYVLLHVEITEYSSEDHVLETPWKQTRRDDGSKRDATMEANAAR